MLQFPEKFAVLGTQSSRGPYWQLLQSRHISSGLTSNSFYEISPLSWTYPLSDIEYPDISDWVSHRTLSVRSETGELKVLKYWQFPMSLYTGNEYFPVIHFEYKAWLPRPLSRVPHRLDDIGVQGYVLQEYNRKVNAIMNTHEDTVRRRLFDSLPRRPATPPLPSRSVSPASTDSDDAHSVMSIYPHYHTLDYPLLPPSPTTSPPPSKPLPIPELVGTLLIQNASQGEDTCPISTVPYKELRSLSATSCFHVFDTESIQTWLKEHKQCPVCRHSIANMVTKQLKN